VGLNLLMWLPESWNIQPGVYAVVAATAVLAGVFRSSISLVSCVHSHNACRGVSRCFQIIYLPAELCAQPEGILDVFRSSISLVSSVHSHNACRGVSRCFQIIYLSVELCAQLCASSVHSHNACGCVFGSSVPVLKSTHKVRCAG